MKRILFLIIFLLLIDQASSVHKPPYLNQLVDKISQDCARESLILPDGWFRYENRNITIVDKWTKEDLISILSGFDNLSGSTIYTTPSSCETSPAMSTGLETCGILKCGNHKLDKSGDDFYWDSIKFEESRYNFNIAQANGEGSLASAGDNNQITQNNRDLLVNLFWSQGTIGGVILSGIISGFIWFVKRVLYYNWKTRKTSKNSRNRQIWRSKR